MVNEGGSGGMVPDNWLLRRLRKINKGGSGGMVPDNWFPHKEREVNEGGREEGMDPENEFCERSRCARPLSCWGRVGLT